MTNSEKILIEAEALAQKMYGRECDWSHIGHMLAVQNALKAMELERRDK